MTISGNTFTLKVDGENVHKGTFSFTGSSSGSLSLVTTLFWVNNNWISYDQKDNGTWSLSGNTLTLSGYDGSIDVNGVWTKQ